MKYLLVILLCCISASHSNAQNNKPSEPKIFETKARAVDAGSMSAGKAVVVLWGVRPLDDLPAVMAERARVALDNAIGNAPVKCEFKSRSNEYLYALCVNQEDEDLGLLMLQQGYVSVDRRLVYDTLYEEPYLEAEQNAQIREIGVWAKEEEAKPTTSGNSIGVMIMVGMLGALVVLLFGALYMSVQRGFKKVLDALNRNADMIGREQKLKTKERVVIASMLDSEIKANKSKIEAYLVVYEEMLADMKNPQRQPKYKKVGDILQKQPALDRAVFDRNTDKLDILGDQLSSEVIHFYARIKTKPDYVNLEPELPLDDAIKLVQEGLAQAKRLDQVADRLIEAFEDNGLSAEALQE